MFLHTKTHFYAKIDRKEYVSNKEKYIQKDGRHYVVILTAINNHPLIIVDAVLLKNNSDNTFC